MNLIKNVLFSRVANAVAAGTTDITTATVTNMAGYDGCCFVALFGAITNTAVTAVRVQQDTISTFTNGTDLEGSSVALATTTADSNKILINEIYRPQEQYLKPVVDRATANAVLDGIIAIQYGTADKPPTQGTTVVSGSQVLDSPDEGTA